MPLPHPPHPVGLPVGLLVGVLVATLAGCAGTPGSDAPGGRVRVVASTNVWGDIAAAVGGPHVEVTALVTGQGQEPHEFEATPRSALAVSRADVVVRNGGGYDDFVDPLISAHGQDATVLDAVRISGHENAPDLNEHVWYDVPSVQRVARRIAAVLGRQDPRHRASYERNLARLERSLTGLRAEEDRLRGGLRGRSVAVTEPVPLYLTQALGLTNRTPEAFTAGVEEGADVAPRTLQQTLALLSPGPGRVSAVIDNVQTAGPGTERLVTAARSAGVGVVGVRETLPPGRHYVGWLRETMRAIDRTVRRGGGR